MHQISTALEHYATTAREVIFGNAFLTIEDILSVAHHGAPVSLNQDPALCYRSSAGPAHPTWERASPCSSHPAR